MEEKINKSHEPDTYKDEITLEFLVIKFREFFMEVKTYWVTAALIILPFCLYFLYTAYKTPISYPANLSFMLSEEGDSGVAGLGGIASALGFSASSGEYNLEKILSLSKSRNIIQEVFLEEVEMNGKKDFIGNHFIRIYKYHEEWESDTTLQNFFFRHKNFPLFNRTENKVLKILHGKVIGNREKKIIGLLKSDINEQTGIMKMQISGISEQFSLIFVNTLYNKLSKFYVDKTIGKQNKTYQIMRDKLDSIRNELDVAQYQYLKFQDQNRNTQLRVYEAQKFKIQRNIQVLGVAYEEALKNQEVADFALRSSTPFINVIDAPIPPLIPKSESKIRALIIGGLFGGFLAVAFILGRKIIRETIQAIDN